MLPTKANYWPHSKLQNRPVSRFSLPCVCAYLSCSKWQCPLCGCDIVWEGLQVDGYFAHVVRQTPAHITTVGGMIKLQWHSCFLFFLVFWGGLKLFIYKHKQCRCVQKQNQFSSIDFAVTSELFALVQHRSELAKMRHGQSHHQNHH
jgi:hypothetical protein